MLWRGATKRCAVCGKGRLFRRWFVMLESCPRCGLTFERVPGHYVGALGMNTVVTFGLLLATIVGAMVLTWPDIPFVPTMVAALAVAGLTPLLFYPFSKTLWTAIDLAMRPLRPGEVKMPYGPIEDRPPERPAPDDLPPWGP